MGGLGSESGRRRLRARSSDTHISHSARDVKGKKMDYVSPALVGIWVARTRHNRATRRSEIFAPQPLVIIIYSQAYANTLERRGRFIAPARVLMAIKVETCCWWPFVLCASLCFTLFVLSQHNKQPDA
jgi:hypothetical protein